MAPCRDVAVAMVVLAAVMVLGAQGDWCPRRGQFVYPYPSNCWSPALYYGQEVYELATAVPGAQSLYLAPEWDESSSSYRVRLAEVGAKYKFTHLTRELRTAVRQNETLLLENVDTGRALSWQEGADGEWLLVEGAVGRSFQFTQVDIPLVCSLLPQARCEAYYILSNDPSQGLSAFEQDGVTSLKLGSTDLLPIVLQRSTTSVLKMPA